MSKAKFTSNRSDFRRKHDSFVDLLQGFIAQDIDVAIKTSAGTPVDKGDMKAETRFFKRANGGYRVVSEKEYSTYQELGVRLDGTHVVENYTTAGTSAGWFRRAIDSVWANRHSLEMEAKRAAGL
jgi:hypothetical protein